MSFITECNQKIEQKLKDGVIDQWEFIRLSNLIRVYERTMPSWFTSAIIR